MPNKLFRVIGITGGVGAGKSTILNFIQDHYKCRIIFTDDLAKELCISGEVCFEPLVDLLGRDVLSDDGEIDKAKMAEAIYRDSSLRIKVNDIIHPAVYDRILQIIKTEKEAGNIEFLFIEAALLIECGYNKVVDEMWYIYADEPSRRIRLKASRGYTDERIDGILKGQLSEDEFRRGSDFVIDNSGSPEESFKSIRERMKEYE